MRSLSILAGLASLAAADPRPEPFEVLKRAALDDCLRDSGVPTTATNSVAPFNRRVPYTPVAVAVPTTLGHIQAAVVCGTKNRVKINAKGGGHSYSSLGLGGENGHLVINLERMNGVKLDPDTGEARVQGGARVGHVATQLYSLGRRALPHGTCPSVGIGGQALHGGFGMSSHWKGLTLDWIVGATVVLADGRVHEVSKDQNKDLLWALRGAGSAFGVVAELRFDTFDAPSNATVFAVTLNWNNEQTIKNGLTAFRNFAKDNQPAEMNMRLNANGQGTTLEGVYYGSTQQFNNAIQPLLKNAGGTVRSARTMGWIESLNAYANNERLDVTYPYNTQETFYAKSLQLQDLTGNALNNFVKYWASNARTASGGRNWWVQVDVHGGKNSAVGSVAGDATAYGHRNKLFLIQFYDRVAGNNGQYPANGFDFLDGWVDTTIAAVKEDWGMYYNYADVRMTKDDALWNYWGDNAWRLQDIKQLVDPNNVFYNPISIEPVKPKAPAQQPQTTRPPAQPTRTTRPPAKSSSTARGKAKGGNGKNQRRWDI